MKLKTRAIFVCLLALALALLAAGCGREQTPYQINDSENFTVSVAYNANGGTFTTNAPVIVDAYNISQLPVNGDGLVEIPLLAPDDAQRGKDAFTATRNGYFLAGWYVEYQQTTDSQGNVTEQYGTPWDFASDRLTADPQQNYTSAEPVLTLYAAWVPMYQIEFYDLTSGELLATRSFDPNEGTEFTVPAWDTESGSLDMYKFPSRDGYTFLQAYYDPQGTQPVQTETVVHNGTLDLATATAENSVLKLYLDWTEGEWYRISTPEQFVDNFTLDGCYDIMADLDFTDEIWPTIAMYGDFTGTIRGNGHTISNVQIVQNDNNKANAGLFGQLSGTAQLLDITFDHITFTVKKGPRLTGTAYGLLCGTAAEGAAAENVAITNSQLQLDSGAYFATEDYVIGLVCGMGQLPVDHTAITCQPVGDDPESVCITVTDATVTVEFVVE